MNGTRRYGSLRSGAASGWKAAAAKVAPALLVAVAQPRHEALERHARQRAAGEEQEAHLHPRVGSQHVDGGQHPVRVERFVQHQLARVPLAA
jgi:hypothetical protein